jgi:hypothetical protein
MPRPYHSPSSIALGATCERAWAYQYIDKLRDPNLPWDDRYVDLKWDFAANCFVLPSTGEKVSAAQRGSALGLGLHETAERWYDPTRGAPDWNWFPGQVLASGKHLLPEPGKIKRVIIEQAIGDVPLLKKDRPAHDREPVVAMLVEGILWSGFVDNEAHGGDELRRLGIVAPDGVATIDYKTSSKIDEYALTRAELLADPQGALYAISGCRKLGLTAMPERWVYFESKKKRRALAVDVTAELTRAIDVIGPCADLARKLDMITRSEDAQQNPDACTKYGNPDRINCRHHVVNGGDCNPKRRRFGSLVQLHTKKQELTMALSAEERQAAFKAKKAEAEAKAAAAAAGGGAPDPEPSEADKSDGEAEGPEVQETAPEAATEAVKPAAAKPTPVPKPAAPKPTKPADGSQAATIAALALELAGIDKQREAVIAKIRAAVAA